MISNQLMQGKSRVLFAGFVILLIMAVFSLAGCSLDWDSLIPGIDSDNGSNTVNKPEKLSSNATYDEVVAKIDEIIKYCEDQPGVMGINAMAGEKIKKYKDESLLSLTDDVEELKEAASYINTLINALQ
jgi:hypothetical protein